MNTKPIVFCVVALVGLSVFVFGCSRGATPKTMAVSDIPAQLDKLFANAPDSTKTLVRQAKSALAVNDLSGAWVALQSLSEEKNLSKQQKQFLASAIVTIGAEVNKASEQGDAQAQGIQRMHRLSK